MPSPEGPAGDLMKALFMSGYFLQVVKLTELTGALLVLSGKLTPLGLLFLAPVIVNIFLFHLILAPEGLPVAIVLVALESFLGWVYFERFRSIFSSPTAQE